MEISIPGSKKTLNICRIFTYLQATFWNNQNYSRLFPLALKQNVAGYAVGKTTFIVNAPEASLGLFCFLTTLFFAVLATPTDYDVSMGKVSYFPLLPSSQVQQPNCPHQSQ
jgi:hypothetical protein